MCPKRPSTKAVKPASATIAAIMMAVSTISLPRMDIAPGPLVHADRQPHLRMDAADDGIDASLVEPVRHENAGLLQAQVFRVAARGPADADVVRHIVMVAEGERVAPADGDL